MSQHSIPFNVLVGETVALLLRFIVLVVLIGLACIVLYFLYGNTELVAVPVSCFFTLLFFSAPLASSVVRARCGVRLLTKASGKILLYSFGWGAVVVGLFIATLQIWQGAEATIWNYVVAMAVAGFVGASTAAIPSIRCNGAPA